MTNKFLFKSLMNYVPKNKMDLEINTYFQTRDALLISSRSDLTNFRRSIRAKVKEIHAAYPRCKNIPLDLFSLSGEDESLRCGCSIGVIYNIESEFKTLE